MHMNVRMKFNLLCIDTEVIFKARSTLWEKSRPYKQGLREGGFSGASHPGKGLGGPGLKRPEEFRFLR